MATLMRRMTTAAVETKYIITERTLRELQQLNLHTSADLPGMAPKQETAHIRGVRLCHRQHATFSRSEVGKHQ